MIVCCVIQYILYLVITNIMVCLYLKNKKILIKLAGLMLQSGFTS